MRGAFTCVLGIALGTTLSCQSGPSTKPTYALHLDDIHDAEDWFLAMRAYPSGIPTGGRVHALAQAAALDAARASTNRIHPLTSNPSSWFPIGPTPVDGFAGAGNDVSGRGTSLAVNPFNVAETWMGTATGGVWHTTNAQTSDPDWQPVTELETIEGGADANGGTIPATAMAMSIGSLAVDACSATQGCARVWIGTGEDGIRRESYYGAGLFLQTPEPIAQIKHAKRVTAGGDPLTQVADFSYGSVVAIAIPKHDPATPSDTLYAAVSSGVTAAGNEETTTAPAAAGLYGVYMSTTSTVPGSYHKLNIPGIDRSLPTDVQFDPNDTNQDTVLVGVMAKDPADPLAARGILRGTNHGTTWCSLNDNSTAGIPCCGASCSQATTGLPPGNSYIATLPPYGQEAPDEILGEITLAFSPNQNGRLYALVGQCSVRVDGGCPFAAYRSENDGQTWTSLPVGQVLGTGQNDYDYQTYGRYTHAIAIPPKQAPGSEQIVLGGKDIWICDGVGTAGCVRPTPGSNHADQHAILFPDPNNPSLAYNADDGGFFYTTGFSTNPSQPPTWSPGNTTPTTIQIDGLAIVDQTLLAGLQDNGLAIFTGSRVWQFVSGGDGGQVVATSSGTPTTATWMSTIQRGMPLIWQGTPSQSGTYNVPPTAFQTGSAPNEFVNEGPGPAQCAYFPPLGLDQQTGDLFIASVQIYKSTDHGNSWNSISPVLPKEQNAIYQQLDTDNVITAMDVAGDGTIYAGDYIGEIWEGNASGSGWTQIGGPGSSKGSNTPSLPVSSISIKPGDSSVAYVSYSGFGTPNHVWSFTGNGASNTAVSNGLVDAPANVVRFDVLGNLWLGTDVGIYRMSGGTWTHDQSLPQVPVTAIVSWPTSTPPGERVYAGTHGRGVWILSQPNVTTLEGWSNGSIWDVPVFGTGFGPSASSCTIYLIQESGNVCASDSTDVSSSNYGPGLPIRTDSNGNLITGAGGSPNCSGSNQPVYCWDNKPVAWACREGTCLKNTPIKDCNVDKTTGLPDLLSTVLVDCGTVGGQGTATILDAPSLGNPPSPSQASLQFDPPSNPPPHVPPPPPMWTFDAVVSIASPQAARLLCTAPVSVPQNASDDQLASATAMAINTTPQCLNEGIIAQASSENVVHSEDEAVFAPTVSVSSTTQVGWQLFVTFRAAPGASTGLCFIADGLGDQLNHQSAIMQHVFATAPGGATGGAVRIVEQTNIGTCQQDVRTTPGMNASQVVNAIKTAFGTVTPPGPPSCLSRANALDLQPSGATLFSVLARRIMICSFDTGVGVATTPDTVDVPNLPPDCSKVTVTPGQLWPPDHKMDPVSLSTAIDPDGDPVTMAITRVTQDENPRGEIDAQLVGGQLLLRAERDGNGEGRVYHIDFTATDSQGASCKGDVTVCVPHDQGTGDSCVDLGALYPSGVP